MAGRFGLACSVLVLVLATTLSGCNQAGITVRIPDFESAEVLGMWVLRWDSELKTYLPHADVIFHQPRIKDGKETMVYEVPGAVPGSYDRLTTTVRRTKGNANEVTLVLVVPIGAGGTFKVSTFNEGGLSLPSLDVLRF